MRLNHELFFAWLLLLPFIGVNQAHSKELLERIIAVVNGEMISYLEFEEYRKKLKNRGLVDESLLQFVNRAELIEKDQALTDHLIDIKLIDAEVRKQNLQVTIERVEAEIRSITDRNSISREQLKSALADQGVRFSDYQNFLKSSLERQSLIEKEITSKIKVSDDDVSAYFFNTKGKEKNQIFEFELAHVLFVPHLGGVESALKRAEDALRRLKSNALSFEKLASQFSEDPNFNQDGYLGAFRSGEMMKEFEEGIRNTRVGEHSEIVKSRVGFHIIKVLKRTLIDDPALEPEKAKIRSQLMAESFERQFKLWLNRKREEAFIRINPS